MIIGIPKEIKNNENRVALTPAGAQELVKRGHTVYVQATAGVNSGFADEAYTAVGAEILPTIGDVYARAEMIVKVKEPIAPEYKLIRKDQLVFTFFHFASSEALTRAMIASGIDVVYHSLRLGEGRTTCFRPEERKATLAAVRDSDLKLAHLVEPVGPEHTDDEIADVLMAALSNGAALSGAMARINVKGTPFESHDPLPDLRLAQIVAITRICGGVNVPDICVHPPRKEALEWGANVVVVETGAVPRNDAECSAEWQGFTVADAKQLFRDAGYFVKD